MPMETASVVILIVLLVMTELIKIVLHAIIVNICTKIAASPLVVLLPKQLILKDISAINVTRLVLLVMEINPQTV
jgi:hypothetical protein